MLKRKKIMNEIIINQKEQSHQIRRGANFMVNVDR